MRFLNKISSGIERLSKKVKGENLGKVVLGDDFAESFSTEILDGAEEYLNSSKTTGYSQKQFVTTVRVHGGLFAKDPYNFEKVYGHLMGKDMQTLLAKDYFIGAYVVKLLEMKSFIEDDKVPYDSLEEIDADIARVKEMMREPDDPRFKEYEAKSRLKNIQALTIEKTSDVIDNK